jgi:hypothetical protein
MDIHDILTTALKYCPFSDDVRVSNSLYDYIATCREKKAWVDQEKDVEANIREGETIPDVI